MVFNPFSHESKIFGDGGIHSQTRTCMQKRRRRPSTLTLLLNNFWKESNTWYRLIIAFPTRLDSRRTSQTCASSNYVVDSGGLLGIPDAKNTLVGFQLYLVDVTLADWSHSDFVTDVHGTSCFNIFNISFLLRPLSRS